MFATNFCIYLLFLALRYPVLLAVDDFQALYHRTKYRDPQYFEIQSFHLSLPRLILEYANGTRSFARGAILGAIGSEDKRFSTSVELAEAIGSPLDHPPTPYSPRYKEYIDYARGLESFAIPPRLSLLEASAIFELWMEHRTLHTRE